MKTHIFSFTVGALITLLVVGMVLGGSSCKESESYAVNDITGITGECNDIVLARVDDAEITLGDLLTLPQIYMVLDEQLIQQELVKQESARRGIVVSMEEVQVKVDEFIEGNGGWDAFVESIPPAIPIDLVPDDIRKSFIIQAMKDAIIDDIWQSEHGPVTYEELEEAWNANSEMYQNRLAIELEMEIEDVTMEMARDLIEEELKGQFTGELAYTFFAELSESANIENYLLDQVSGPGEVDVPPATEDTHVEESTDEHGLSEDSTDEHVHDEVNVESDDDTVTDTEEASGE